RPSFLLHVNRRRLPSAGCCRTLTDRGEIRSAMATPMLRSAVAGLALERSASLRLPARPASAASFSSNAAAGRFEKRQVDEKNDESDAARRRRKQERLAKLID
uniref:Uncharacterized protein n=1 Tax=Aegilops tauschii subsp. strangulata TaxID=200361 RepID=A0A453KF60_AEGTS